MDFLHDSGLIPPASAVCCDDDAPCHEKTRDREASEQDSYIAPSEVFEHRNPVKAKLFQ
jgi:hypothetical protein